jgi:hypothetical protein
MNLEYLQKRNTAILVLIVSLGALVYGLTCLARLKTLQADAAITAGHAVGFPGVQTRGYMFEVDGETYFGRGGRALLGQEEVVVTYSCSNPRLSRPSADDFGHPTWLLFGGVGLIGAALFLGNLRKEAESLPVPGTKKLTREEEEARFIEKMREEERRRAA